MDKRKIYTIILTTTMSVMVLSPNVQALAETNSTLTTSITKVVDNNEKIHNTLKSYPNTIQFHNWWGTLVGTMTFDITNNTINVTGYDPYLGGHMSDTYLTIGLFNINDNKPIKYSTFKGNDSTSKLKAFINGSKFNYGDIIGISYNTKQGNIDLINGHHSLKLENLMNYYEITEKGLVPFNNNLSVNPINILTGEKVTTGIITGKTNGNSKVIASINNNNFVTKSDSNGNYKLEIKDSNGFNPNSQITVYSTGGVPLVISPVASDSLKILHSNIIFKNQWRGNAEEISFNPITHEINASSLSGNFGSSNLNYFNFKVINGTDGKIIKDINTKTKATADFTKKLNGTKFSLGDVIAITEDKEIGLSLGVPTITNTSNNYKADCLGKTQFFTLTKAGIIPVNNKNLNVNPIEYTGQNNTLVKGVTLPNSNINIYYNDENKVVKSDNIGNFSLNIPSENLHIGTPIRIFVNNENTLITPVVYDTNIYGIANDTIAINNNTNLNICTLSFNPVNGIISAIEPSLDKTYTGTFFGNNLEIQIINPTTGEIIHNFTNDKINDISAFVKSINGQSIKLNDIVKITYNPKLLSVNVKDKNNSIGNTTGKSEYFQITKEGLKNITNKTISLEPLNILGNGLVQKLDLNGEITPNTKITARCNGKTFSSISLKNGKFSIPLTSEKGFTSNSIITVLAEGFIPTTCKLGFVSDIQLNNSFINLYNSQWAKGELTANIALNPSTMQFNVNTYSDSFGNGKSKYLNFNLYSSKGKNLLDININNGETSQLVSALNGKAFNYGDVIGISYNNNISKPIIMNGETVYGNISGEMEYFKITKAGLEPIQFGSKANATKIFWNNNGLNLSLNLAYGQSDEILNSKKFLVITDSKGNEIFNTEANGTTNLTSILPFSLLQTLKESEVYSLNIKVNNILYPISTTINTPSKDKYFLNIGKNNDLEITLHNIAANNIKVDTPEEINNVLEVAKAKIINENLNASTTSNILLSQFINRVGVAKLSEFYSQSNNNANFLNWLLNNNVAMEEYLNGPKPYGTSLTAGQAPGTDIEALKVWSNIWNTYTNSRDGFNLKLAIATSLANASSIKSFPNSSKTVGDPLERYNIFETLNSSGGMFPIFKTLDVSHLYYVVSSRLSNNEIIMERNIILQNHNGAIDYNTIKNVAYTIHYNLTYDRKSVFKNNFYGTNPTVKTVWKNGGVCGATAQMGTFACQAFGLPARLIGQPGHAAFIYYNPNKQWAIGNNIYGWSLSNGSDMSGWSKDLATSHNIVNYDLLFEKADTPELRTSNMYLWLANEQKDYTTKLKNIDLAIKTQPLNIEAWKSKIALLNSNENVTGLDYENLSNNIIEAFKDYPMPMFDLLVQIKDKLASKAGNKYFDSLVNKMTNTFNSVTDSNQVQIAKNMLKAMPSYCFLAGYIPQSNISVVDYSSEQNKTTYSAKNVLDGNPNTTWQNYWNHSDKKPFITIKLDKDYKLNKLLITPRNNGHNGDIENYTIYVSNNGKDFTEVSKGTWDYKDNNSTTTKIATLNDVTAKYVKLVCNKGYYNLATIAEINILGTPVKTSN